MSSSSGETNLDPDLFQYHTMQIVVLDMNGRMAVASSPDVPFEFLKLHPS